MLWDNIRKLKKYDVPHLPHFNILLHNTTCETFKNFLLFQIEWIVISSKKYSIWFNTWSFTCEKNHCLPLEARQNICMDIISLLVVLTLNFSHLPSRSSTGFAEAKWKTAIKTKHSTITFIFTSSTLQNKNTTEREWRCTGDNQDEVREQAIEGNFWNATPVLWPCSIYEVLYENSLGNPMCFVQVLHNNYVMQIFEMNICEFLESLLFVVFVWNRTVDNLMGVCSNTCSELNSLFDHA